MRRHLILCSVQSLWAIACCPCVGEADENIRDHLRVITYNVQFLPEPASHRNERPDPEYRATRIAEQVSRFDLIALQETFHDTYRNQIQSGISTIWKRNLQSVISPTPAGFFTSGGCLLVTKTSMVAQHSTVFANFSKPADYGLRADGFAAKGILHARIRRTTDSDGGFVDVFVTHLEARADDLRPLQYAEIAKFIKQHSSVEHPALLLGDLNTRGAKEFRDDPESQYSQLMQQLASVRSGHRWIDLWAHLHGDSLGGTTEQESSDVGKRIDYILLSNPQPPHSQLVPVTVEVLLFQDQKVKALSDHNAVVATLEWR